MTGAAQGDVGPLLLHKELRFRRKNPPELLELELLPRGWLHRGCLPTSRPPPCEKCGRDAFKRPEAPILDAASLPQDLDLFRLAGFPTMIIGTERFVEVARRLGYEQDIAFHELSLR